MLELIQVKKDYGANRVLDIPYFHLESGIYWLQGPNGAGKTTLLRVIAGILTCKGDIRVQGRSLRKDPVDYRRLVNWGDAEPLYPGFLNGIELVSFYSRILGADKSQMEKLCDLLGIGSWLGARAAVWSSGMTKKISLLLAMLGRPALILLDEPFITLDDAGNRGLTTLINEYHKLYGTAFLLSSHQEMLLPELSRMRIIDHSIGLI
jgi:ABC-2 type transport system ATP-binding protein